MQMGYGLRVEDWELWVATLSLWLCSNALLWCAVARIGEVPQAVEFGNGLWLKFAWCFCMKWAASWHNRLNKFGASIPDLHHFVAYNLCGLCRYHYPCMSADAPNIAVGAATRFRTVAKTVFLNIKKYLKSGFVLKNFFVNNRIVVILLNSQKISTLKL